MRICGRVLGERPDADIWEGLGRHWCLGSFGVCLAYSVFEVLGGPGLLGLGVYFLNPKP